MASNKKEKKKPYVVKEEKSNQCPVKEGDNCKVPGVFSDSDPIGGGG
ncbi:MAG: hypothetical protein PHC92_08040 [Syntrophomonadaceae bacterium]|nr:hypothetical protein [Syntrophomonadaceae bacterium]MDD3022870.1 hypothetical protein [Syntrophomonadaceae bacterium]